MTASTSPNTSATYTQAQCPVPANVWRAVCHPGERNALREQFDRPAVTQTATMVAPSVWKAQAQAWRAQQKNP